MWHRLSFCNRHSYRTIRNECYANFKNGNVRFRFCVFNDHTETKTTNLCLIPNKIKLAQTFFSKWCTHCTQQCPVYLPFAAVPYDFNLKITLQWFQLFCQYLKRLGNNFNLMLEKHSIYEVKILVNAIKTLRTRSEEKTNNRTSWWL